MTADPTTALIERLNRTAAAIECGKAVDTLVLYEAGVALAAEKKRADGEHEAHGRANEYADSLLTRCEAGEYAARVGEARVASLREALHHYADRLLKDGDVAREALRRDDEAAG